MAKKQILLEAWDTGPSKYALDIAVQAFGKNFGVTYFGNNPEIRPDVFEGVAFDCVIVGGPSSIERVRDSDVFDLARRREKPSFVACDVPVSYVRGNQGVISDATAIVAYPRDVEGAKKYGYKDAVFLGYPSHWAKPNEIKPASLPDNFEGLKVFVCGNKQATITNNMLESTLNCLDSLGVDYRAYFQFHPSEIKETIQPERRERLLSSKVTLIRGGSVPELTRACNLSVLTGAATGIPEGALMRLPMIYYTDDLAREYMLKTTNEEIYSVAEEIMSIATPETMRNVLENLISGGDERERLEMQQEKAFPLQTEGHNTAKEIVDYIASF